MFHFENTFSKLPKILFENVEPTPILQPQFVCASESALSLLGLENKDLPEICRWLNAEIRLDGDQRIATRYAGHQFGSWAGQLGDGRAISLGEVINPQGQRWEIQTKGSGLTPFSRMGDGKAVVRSSIREFLCSEHMHALGVPSTRALALLTGKDHVQRESIENSALVARVFPSNIRFGHFEYCFHFKEDDALNQLCDYTRKYFFPNCASEIQMLQEITNATAKLLAQWMSLGFCHGVMNTDNMSILGITIDYGPFGFMEDFDPDWICNHSDHEGRYRYSNQPMVALWNLDRLCVCFSKRIERPALQKIFDSIVPTFEAARTKIFTTKLGLEQTHPDDPILIDELLILMAEHHLDWTFTFRNLAHLADVNFNRTAVNSEKRVPFSELETLSLALSAWLKKYQARIELETTTPSVRFEKMLSINPKYIFKNYISQEIIDDVESGSTQKIQKWLMVLTQPFDEHPELHEYSKPTHGDKKNLAFSCSS